jgi:enoyl-CoA hydratase/carnithine racemase
MSENPPFTDLLISDQHAVRCLTLNRPQSKNGLTIELVAALKQAILDAGEEGSVRAVLISGSGGSFCSGLDLKAAVEMVQAMHSQDTGSPTISNEDRLRNYFHGLIRAVRSISKPVVAFVDGPAAGFGCDLAVACDLRVGTARASFAELFVRRGLMPDGGSTYTLPRLISVGRALELMMLGESVPAEEALRIGLLNAILEDSSLAMQYAQRLAAGPPLVLREIKRAVYDALDGSLDQALEGEVRGQMKLLRTADFAEGMNAFFTKRPPHFTGH